MREALVRQAMPQKSWPTQMISDELPPPSLVLSAEVKTARSCRSRLLMAPTLVTAKMIASSTNQPITAE